ncbi:MAG: sulfatase [Planctomycetaceae bacterium]|nr:sulfatase [Planctomycetaceae bacterium]
MNRHPFWLLLGMILSAGSGVAADRPNILFIAVDDLRPELGCYGVEHIQSPRIDAFAKTAVTFRRAYCQQAVCSPSRTSLLTGLRPDTTRVYDLETHFRKTIPDVVTLPQRFQQAGYHTVGMGKIYHGGLDDPASWSEPWSTVNRPAYASAESMERIRLKQQQAKAKGLKGKAASRAARGPVLEAGDVEDNFYTDGALAEKAVARMEQLAGGDQPFFLAVGFLKPHLPFIAPRRYFDLYPLQSISLADNPFHPHGAPPFALTNSGEMRVYDGIPKSGPVDDETARRLRQAYYACVSYTDANIGRLLDGLERLKLSESTIVVLWGDHGWKLGEHGEWCKHSTVENDTHVVLMMRAPGRQGMGQSSDALVEFVDIYPTLCELAKIDASKELEGTSFARLLDDPTRDWKTAAFSQYPRTHEGVGLMGYSLRTDKFRYTRWVERRDPSKVVAEELYDEQTDPAENENIAEKDEFAKTLATLREQMDAGWRGARPRE